MLLVGRFQSPFVRRTGIVLMTLGMTFETKGLTTANDTPEITKYNPVGRVPSLVLDDGEIVIDSQAIIDYALEVADPKHRLLATSGADRRAVLRTSVIAVGAMEKGVASAYERTRRPKDKVFQDWVDRVDGQAATAMKALEAFASKSGQWLHGDHMTLADINAVVAFDFVRRAVPYIMKDGAHPALAKLSARCNELPAFAETRPKA